MMRRVLVIALAFACAVLTVLPCAAAARQQDDSTTIEIGYRNRRIEMETADGNWAMQLQWRFQFRLSTPFDAIPTSDPVSALEAADQMTLRVRRARLKVGGHAYRPWLGYYLEYDFPSTNLLDWRMTVGPSIAQVRIGQWKVNYSRERVSSSGEQQFVERSIVNEIFTYDRQVGVMALGHVFPGTHADLRYYLGILNGTGSNASANDDGHMLWLGRLEWQPLGTDPEMEAGDLERRREPALTIAGAAATNRSPYTRFSGSGGGQLAGFAAGEPGQYRVPQAMFETAVKYRGFSWQHETHWKRVEDTTEDTETSYHGSYVQAGFFPSELLSGVPAPLEVAFRWAGVHGGPPAVDSDIRELGAVANWYLAGHKNKVTVDLSHVRAEEGGSSARGWRLRAQWDVSF